MRRSLLFWVLFLVLAACLVGNLSTTSAATIFESGSLGPTGISRTDIATVGGSNVDDVVFVGVRFLLEEPVVTTQVGGHFVKDIGASPSFFAAIISLDDQNDFPDSGALSMPDVVGSTLLAFPETSAEVKGNLSKVLDPGWYALLFGSGLFGATGEGVAISNNPDIRSPSYIGFQPGFGWSNLEGFLSDFRFVVDGNIVPEPTTILITAAGCLCLLSRRGA